MFRTRLLALAALTAAMAFVSGTVALAPGSAQKEEWTALFNGRDLDETYLDPYYYALREIPKQLSDPRSARFRNSVHSAAFAQLEGSAIGNKSIERVRSLGAGGLAVIDPTMAPTFHQLRAHVAGCGVHEETTCIWPKFDEGRGAAVGILVLR